MTKTADYYATPTTPCINVTKPVWHRHVECMECSRRDKLDNSLIGFCDSDPSNFCGDTQVDAYRRSLYNIDLNYVKQAHFPKRDGFGTDIIYTVICTCDKTFYFYKTYRCRPLHG